MQIEDNFLFSTSRHQFLRSFNLRISKALELSNNIGDKKNKFYELATKNQKYIKLLDEINEEIRTKEEILEYLRIKKNELYKKTSKEQFLNMTSGLEFLHNHSFSDKMINFTLDFQKKYLINFSIHYDCNNGSKLNYNYENYENCYKNCFLEAFFEVLEKIMLDQTNYQNVYEAIKDISFSSKSLEFLCFVLKKYSEEIFMNPFLIYFDRERKKLIINGFINDREKIENFEIIIDPLDWFGQKIILFMSKLMKIINFKEMKAILGIYQ